MKVPCNTIAVDRVLPKFLDILEKQFVGCGDKYAFTDKAEWTDVLGSSDPYWVNRTMEKYVGRYKQYHAGRDLIKVATYAFIQAIKFGLVGTLDPIVMPEIEVGALHCTTVPAKVEYWPDFREMVEYLAEVLITKRRTYYVPDAWSSFDVTRNFAEDMILGQILAKSMEFEYQFEVHKKRWTMAIIAFLCFVQWCQDGHHLAEKIDDDDPRETNGRKVDVEELGGDNG